jgi:hypothetical protein
MSGTASAKHHSTTLRFKAQTNGPSSSSAPHLRLSSLLYPQKITSVYTLACLDLSRVDLGSCAAMPKYTF